MAEKLSYFKQKAVIMGEEYEKAMQDLENKFKAYEAEVETMREIGKKIDEKVKVISKANEALLGFVLTIAKILQANEEKVKEIPELYLLHSELKNMSLKKDEA